MRGLNAVPETTKPRFPGLCGGQLNRVAGFGKAFLAESEGFEPSIRFWRILP